MLLSASNWSFQWTWLSLQKDGSHFDDRKYSTEVVFLQGLVPGIALVNRTANQLMSRGGYWFVSICFSNKQSYLSRVAQGRKTKLQIFSPFNTTQFHPKPWTHLLRLVFVQVLKLCCCTVIHEIGSWSTLCSGGIRKINIDSDMH